MVSQIQYTTTEQMIRMAFRFFSPSRQGRRTKISRRMTPGKNRSLSPQTNHSLKISMAYTKRYMKLVVILSS